MGILAAAAWALFEYYGHAKDERVQEVLSYRHELRTPPLFNSWTTAMTGTKDTAERLHLKGEALRRYSLENAERRYASLVSIFRYYDDLNNCVSSGLCDKKTADIIFGYEAHFLYDNYIAFIGCRRLYEKHFAKGLIHFMSRYFRAHVADHHKPRLFVPSVDMCPPEKNSDQ